MDKRIGGRHTSIDNLRKGVPPHFQRNINGAIKDLVKWGFIVKKTTSYGMQVSLNVNMIPEVERILEI
jgi:hypothetical protein